LKVRAPIAEVPAADINLTQEDADALLQIVLTKGTYLNRARGVAILARLDFGGAPHRNPDDQEIPYPHRHLYREGYGDRWAIPLPAERFSDVSDSWLLLLELMQFVNITMLSIADLRAS
jgi:hypothetical protein